MEMNFEKTYCIFNILDSFGGTITTVRNRSLKLAPGQGQKLLTLLATMSRTIILRDFFPMLQTCRGFQRSNSQGRTFFDHSGDQKRSTGFMTSPERESLTASLILDA